MKIYLLLIVLFSLVPKLKAQELFGAIGQNFTFYDYTNANGEKLDGLMSGSGACFEGGASVYFSKHSKFLYQGSLTFNKFNASAYVNELLYSWKTNYLGIQNVVIYKAFESKTSFALRLKGGVNVSHIIGGKQDSYGNLYKLSNNDEFKGLFIQPLVGLDLAYHLSEHVYVSATYSFSKAFSTKSTPETLHFTNHQIQIGLHFTPKVMP